MSLSPSPNSDMGRNLDPNALPTGTCRQQALDVTVAQLRQWGCPAMRGEGYLVDESGPLYRKKGAELTVSARQSWLWKS